jgi:methylenetetrahydrofolate dehydrogenase (NADP+)/methenyltetrahydrofolate cyclohydrolase
MILNGKVVAASIKEQLKEEIDAAVVNGCRRPRLVIISVGDDPASKVYVRNKTKAAEEVGIIAHHFPMQSDLVTTEYVKESVALFNADPSCDGIMVQLPLPKHLDERAIIDAIDPAKDVDGLTTTNIGRLRSGQECLKPCTAAGIMDLLNYYDISVDYRNVTILGRSNIVGKPIADMMMAAGATVTQCHSHTANLDWHTSRSDIIVSAIGKPRFITEDMIPCGVVVVDVGINRDENGKLCGDVDYENAWVICGSITPVPGGVGPMTVAELMKNVVIAWRNNNVERTN